jgi:hypothetical protein
MSATCSRAGSTAATKDGRDGKLRHAAIFGTDELDELVERALAENRKPGQNVYIGQALRHPDIAAIRTLQGRRFLGAHRILRRHR